MAVSALSSGSCPLSPDGVDVVDRVGVLSAELLRVMGERDGFAVALRGIGAGMGESARELRARADEALVGYVFPACDMLGRQLQPGYPVAGRVVRSWAARLVPDNPQRAGVVSRGWCIVHVCPRMGEWWFLTREFLWVSHVSAPGFLTLDLNGGRVHECFWRDQHEALNALRRAQAGRV